MRAEGRQLLFSSLRGRSQAHPQLERYKYLWHTPSSERLLTALILTCRLDSALLKNVQCSQKSVSLLSLGTVLVQVTLFGRFVVGMGVGLGFVVYATYTSEVAPPDRRGQLVACQEVAQCFGEPLTGGTLQDSSYLQRGCC